MNLKNSLILKNKQKEIYMNLAKISANGQITVPSEIRQMLVLKSGGKILFIQKPTGEVVINNASAEALYKAQNAFSGVAEKIGAKNDNDVMDMIREVRHGEK